MEIRVTATAVFEKWFKSLRDKRTRSIIQVHIRRLNNNNLGVFKPLGGGLFEKKIDYGPGYRLYFCQRGVAWILLLCGGDKSRQDKDIKLAQKLKEEVENGKTY
ncbi:toxin ParE [Candidatus Termititenax aidoneus]|uniref:Toxin ParE n=1 Tax=Termititenax aidoneus TaxID=2218524 RepID=A0A388TC65_TERA1|nr:toxin ParE [Candidatus Termititenax aidoneus]